MKNLLLPIDFYPDPQKVLKDVISFLYGVSENFKIFLLSTYRVPLSPSKQLIAEHDELKKQSLEKLRKAMHVAQELYENEKITFDLISQMGAPAHVITRVVEEHDIDCVILGMDENLKTEDYLWKHIHCPILILPTSFSKSMRLQS